MANDPVALGNMALANIGQPSVQNFEQSNTASRALKLRYDEARREALSACLWNFASLWQAGVAVDIDPKPGWAYVYSYPTDALRVFEIQRLTVDDKDIPFEVTARPGGAGKLIHTNMADAVFIYAGNVTDTTLFDSDFDTALSWLLSHKIAMAVTKSVKLRDDAMKMWLALADKARARTKNERTEDTDITPTYQAVR